jgi:hypothetical protein
MSSAVLQAPDMAMNPQVAVNIEEKAEQLHLAPVDLKAPVYKQRRFNQVSGGNSITFTTNSSSTILSQFNIPGDGVWNFARSYLTLDLAAGESATANNINFLLTDSLPIDSITLQTASGQVLANIQNAQIYTKVSQHIATDLEDYLSREAPYADTALGTALPITQIYGCQPCNINLNTGNAVITRTTLQYPASRPSEASVIDTTGGTAAAATASAIPATHASGTDVNNRAPVRVLAGVVRDGGGAGNVQVRYKIPLKAFLGTILAMDKDLYFHQNLQLVIYWKGINNWAFRDVAAGGAPAALNNAAAPTSTNYFLYLYQDINDDNVAVLKNQVMSQGLSVLIPYTTCNQLSAGTATGNFTFSTLLTPGTGLALKRAITVPVNALDVLNLSANTFNVNRVKFDQVQSSLDGKPLQDRPLLIADSTAWNYVRDLIMRSPAGLSARTWEENCFFIDNFSDCYDSTHFYENDVKCSGLPIKAYKAYEVSFNKLSTAALKFCQYQTWVRMLVIKPDGIMWGSVSGQ